jgi:hypothetical protein
MNTLILSPRHSSDTQALWQTIVKRDDWKTHRAYRHQVPEDVENPCVYGGMQFCDIIASTLGLTLLEPPDYFLETLPQEFTKRRVELRAHSSLGQYKERKFIKPANDKVFVAGVYEKGEHVPYKHIQPDCPVIVSDVVEFEVEYRCYTLDREVVTLSCYEWVGMLHQENPDHQKEVLDFMSRLLQLQDLCLPSACVVDVGLIPERGWAVIEANQVYASGIYHEADPERILPLLERASGKGPVRASDAPYVRLL